MTKWKRFERRMRIVESTLTRHPNTGAPFTEPFQVGSDFPARGRIDFRSMWQKAPACVDGWPYRATKH